MNSCMEAKNVPIKRYGEYDPSGADRAEIAVRITAADFNGEFFDGSPFSAKPDWLLNAVRNKMIVCHTRGSTDYAQWDVLTSRGTINATPGDWIVRREKGDLSVVEAQDAFVLINLRPPVRSEGEHDK